MYTQIYIYTLEKLWRYKLLKILVVIYGGVWSGKNEYFSNLTYILV